MACLTYFLGLYSFAVEFYGQEDNRVRRWLRPRHTEGGNIRCRCPCVHSSRKKVPEAGIFSRLLVAKAAAADGLGCSNLVSSDVCSLRSIWHPPCRRPRTWQTPLDTCSLAVNVLLCPRAFHFRRKLLRANCSSFLCVPCSLLPLPAHPLITLRAQRSFKDTIQSV